MTDSDSRPPRRVLRPFVPSAPGSAAAPRSPSSARSAPAAHRLPRPFTPSAPMPTVAPRSEPPIETSGAHQAALSREDAADAAARARVEAGAAQPSPLYEDAIESLSTFPASGAPPAPKREAGGDTASSDVEAAGSEWEDWSETSEGEGGAPSEPRAHISGRMLPPEIAALAEAAQEDDARPGHADDAVSGAHDGTVHLGGPGEPPAVPATGEADEPDADRTAEWSLPASEGGVASRELGDSEALRRSEGARASADDRGSEVGGTPVMSKYSHSMTRADPHSEPEHTELLAGAEFGWMAEAGGTAGIPREAGASGTGARREAGGSPVEEEAVAEAVELELPAALAESADDGSLWDAQSATPTVGDAASTERAESGELAAPPSEASEPVLPHARLVGALEELKEIEPWATPLTEEHDPDPASAIADALERLAGRFREGSLVLPPASHVHSDEGALAIALAALLRHSGR